jgi:hypothetical protein
LPSGWAEGAPAFIPWSANLFWASVVVFHLARSERVAATVAIAALGRGVSTWVFYPRSMLPEAFGWWVAALAVIAVGSLGSALWCAWREGGPPTGRVGPHPPTPPA